jgi:protoporphyrinogen oxidase
MGSLVNNGPVIIIGAGLAGLAAGQALRKAGANYLILESGDRPGGLCRTEEVDGYTFDYTGHLLHLREGASKDLIMERIGSKLTEHERKASVYVKGVFVDYPIQAHFDRLPSPLDRQCLNELLAAADEELPGRLPFDSWAQKRFGPTLARLFMIPYNAKLNVHPLSEMEISWTSWSVPIPTAQELRSIARGEVPPAYGYNATFYYPARGGIEILPRCLAEGQDSCLLTGTRVVNIDAERRQLTLDNGRSMAYRSLISTVPLPDMLKMTGGLPDKLSDAAVRLRSSSVLGICLGLDGPLLTYDHWIYFPETDLPFYRMGFPSNFSERVAPAGCGSVYAEVAWAGSDTPSADRIADRVLGTLLKTGLIGPSTGVAARVDLAIPCAYVFHDQYRADNLDAILQSLKIMGIFSVGRYGAWEYSAMQDAVQWGLEAAGEVLS